MQTKNSTLIIGAVITLLSTVLQTGAAQHAITGFLTSHVGAVAVILGISHLLTLVHVPKADSAASTGDGGKTVALFLCAGLMLLAATPAAHAQEVSEPANIYAAGISYNVGASPAIAGTGLYARKLSDVGTYAFTAVDLLPTTVRPLTLTTNFSTGIAQRVVTIAKIPIYIPTSAGISVSGGNTGWAWTTGALASIKVPNKNLRIMPNVRLVKSSVSGGTGYQPILGVLFGWGQ